MPRFSVLSLLMALLLGPGPAGAALPAPDSPLTRGLDMGEAIGLQAGEGRFYAIRTTAVTPEPVGGVVLLHGEGAHPDWPGVVGPLRRGLAEHGWTTLAIALPDAGAGGFGERFAAARLRIAAAVEELRAAGLPRLVIIGHGLGAAMGLDYLATQQPPPPDVAAFVGIGMAAPARSDAHLDTAGAIAALDDLPILDIFGGQDRRLVTATATRRRYAARRAGNEAYRQDRVAVAGPEFRHDSALLVRRVRGWLQARLLTPATGGDQPTATAADEEHQDEADKDKKQDTGDGEEAAAPADPPPSGLERYFTPPGGEAPTGDGDAPSPEPSGAATGQAAGQAPTVPAPEPPTPPAGAGELF